MSQLEHILVRLEKAADILRLEPWLHDKLRGFKNRWLCDIEAKMDDGTLKTFTAVRIWHRSPHTDQPHKGGLRFHPNVSMDVMEAHAMEMSWKCWIMGLEWGGAKGGVALDPAKYSLQELKNITEAFVDEMDERNILGPFRDVPAPDVGTNPRIMNWIRQRYAQRRRSREDARFAGVVTGKPVGYGYGGIPGRQEATGFGLVEVFNTIMSRKEPALQKLRRAAVMGFGNVGFHAAYSLYCRGYTVIAVSDVNGGVYNPKGLPGLVSAKSISDLASQGERITNAELLELPDVDILVPAALENVITAENAHRIHAKIIVEGANGPTTPQADEVLEQNGVLVIPDILANAGGVTVSFFEWARNVNIKDERVPTAERDAVLSSMSRMLQDATKNVCDYAERYGVSLRHAAYLVAIDRAAPLFRTKHTAE